MAQVHGRLLAAAVAVYAAWCAGQVLVARHWVRQIEAFNRTEVAHLRALEARRVAAGLSASPSPIHNAIPIPASRWLHASAEGVVAMALVLALGTALVLGGRRWWSLIVAGIPAAAVIGKFQDGAAIGGVWASFLFHTERWEITGVVVDTVAVIVIIALVVAAIPREPSAVPVPTGLLRGALPAVILLGWWLIQNPVDADGSRKVWIAQGVVWVLAVALLVSSSLPIVAKVIAGLVVAPYMSLTMLDDLVGGYGHSIDTTQFTHHALYAAGVMAWVAGVPALVKLAQKHRSSRGKGALAQV